MKTMMKNFMCRSTALLMVFVCLVLLMGAPRAIEPDDLYTVEVPVKDDSPEQRSQGFVDALKQVMVRLSGDLDVNNHADAASLLTNAPSLVQQFRYRLEQTPDTHEQDAGALGQQRYLWTKFDKAQLDSLLQQARIPVWSKQRPQVLLWLAMERAGKRELFNLEEEPASRKLLRQQAALRGLPLQFPLVDLADQSLLSAADIWANYATAIKQASQRYPHDVVLTGQLRHLSEDNWSAIWTLFSAEDRETFAVHSNSWQAALKSGINGAQNRLMLKYAPAVDAQGSDFILVRFTQVESVGDYGRLQKLLNAQESIQRYTVQEAKKDELLLKLWVHGGQSTLSRHLTLTGELSVANSRHNANFTELVFNLSRGIVE